MIHWQYIKGAYKEDNSQSNTPYTFLDFYGGNDFSGTTVTETMLPMLQLATDTNGTNKKPAGHIITSDIVQTFTKRIDFQGNLGVQTIYGDITGGQHQFSTVLRTSSTTLYLAENGYSTFYIYSPQCFAITNLLTDQRLFQFSGRGYITNSLRVGTTSPTKSTSGYVSAQNLYSTGICEAQYFNATSDRRAKTDIKPISQSVLPLVTSTQLYSFKYKDLDTPSIGIIAQDVRDVDFNGFSLVDNKEATGQDMDYMSIHESKLIYVLWKAVQEQQKEIEELKAQIKKGL